MFRADLDGKKLTFEMTGLKGSNFVMRDRQTGSRWQQATGEAFEGPLKGKRLALVPFLLTTWKEWRTQHPQTVALVPEADLKPEYQRMGQMIASFPFRRPMQGSLRDDSRLPAMERVIGLEVGNSYKAYRKSDLKKQSVVNDQVGATAVLIVHSPISDTVTAFLRRLKGRVLTFRAKSSNSPQLVDVETGSRWSYYGECVEGKLKGSHLETVIPLPSFWFSWAEFFPQTEIYKGSGD